MELTDIFPFAPDDGYLILILVNFIGSLIPFVPLPGFLLLATMSVGSGYDLHLLAILSAISATVAKQIIFFVSFGGRKIMNNKTRQRMRPFERLVKMSDGQIRFFGLSSMLVGLILLILLS